MVRMLTASIPAAINEVLTQCKADRPVLKYTSQSPVNISSAAAMFPVALSIALAELSLRRLFVCLFVCVCVCVCVLFTDRILNP